MFVRVKKSGSYSYLQVVHNQRCNGRVGQRVLATLGRLDQLQQNGQLDQLVQSAARFTQHSAVLNAVRQRQLEPLCTVRVGPPLVFQRLWEQLGLPQVFDELLRERRFEFALERAVFLTVLHRLFASGSDRAAEAWCRRYDIAGSDDLQLQHLYRAMAWLGEVLPQAAAAIGEVLPQAASPPATGTAAPAPDPGRVVAALGARCQKDRIEEALFARRRDLFSSLRLAFFDTTSLYFEGAGGDELGQHGFSKDHRPDLKQMVLGMVLDETGRPICCELWPGNTADVTTLVPVADRLSARFGIRSVCLVADRGMISQETKRQLAQRGWQYILGARLRSVSEVREEVLSRAGRYHEVHGPRQTSKDSSPLKVKEVWVEDRRYVVCVNAEQARKDAADREAIVAKLRDQLQHGIKSLVGNKGFRKYLQADRDAFAIDEAKIRDESRYDGKWVLETNTDLATGEVALRYKDLWMVEQVFRSLKSVLETRPIYHKCDETVRGHVFCSFLALVMLKELQGRLEERGWSVEWDRLRDNLESLQEITVQLDDKRFVLRSNVEGDAGKALQAAGVALPPAIRQLEPPPRPTATDRSKPEV